MNRLSVKGLALGLAVPWSLCVLFAGWLSPAWASGFVQVFSIIYPGYSAGFVGGIIGEIESLADGAVAGATIALVYNRFGK